MSLIIHSPELGYIILS